MLGVASGWRAEAAGLKTFERILQINGGPVKDEPAFVQAVAKARGRVELKVERFEPIELPGANVQVPDIKNAYAQKQDGEGFAALGAESADLYVAAVVRGSAAEQAGS